MEEKAHNPRLGLAIPKEKFVEIMAGLKLPYPKQIDAALPLNLVCGYQDRVPPPSAAVAAAAAPAGAAASASS